MGAQQYSQCLGRGAGPEWGWGSTGPAGHIGSDPEELVGSLPCWRAGLWGTARLGPVAGGRGDGWS